MGLLFPILLSLIVWASVLPAQCGEYRAVQMGSFSKAVDYAPYIVAKQKKLFVAGKVVKSVLPGVRRGPLRPRVATPEVIREMAELQAKDGESDSPAAP